MVAVVSYFSDRTIENKIKITKRKNEVIQNEKVF
jgi:hypothetical protein